ncbi:hypothetical protein EYF80_022622 [Liparis tanakae]|uniref:Uncharacterized protein n=1 Tax=Liparis tanakae TaxID=230148 RepID=A0A4Z2HQN6_9TELE|nr:hypothetical protein EYF80_022622 [Liparis tanakae]
MAYLSQQSHEAGGRHHADLARQRLGDGRPALLLAAAVRHDHRVRLSEERPGRAQLAELDQLQHHLDRDAREEVNRWNV